MKIRTDFVTNSSSSSYALEIVVRDDTGKEYSASIEDTRSDYGKVDLKCSTNDIRNVASVEELIELLSDSIDISSHGKTKSSTKLIGQMGNEVKQNVSDIDHISNIVLKRKWFAWGEGCSCFGWNLNLMARELPGLARKVCESKGVEKEIAKQEMMEYLEHFYGVISSESGHCFPSGFMDSKVDGVIVWNSFVDSIEELAQRIIDEDLPKEDHAEEITEIDMKTGTVTQKAEYTLNNIMGY